MSIDAVASSMMKMLVFLTKALARQKSCLWPWLKFSPPSVTIASGSDTAKSVWSDQNRAYTWKIMSHFQHKVIFPGPTAALDTVLSAYFQCSKQPVLLSHYILCIC